jgi:hypothetical protein
MCIGDLRLDNTVLPGDDNTFTGSHLDLRDRAVGQHEPADKPRQARLSSEALGPLIKVAGGSEFRIGHSPYSASGNRTTRDRENESSTSSYPRAVSDSQREPAHWSACTVGSLLLKNAARVRAMLARWKVPSGSGKFGALRVGATARKPRSFFFEHAVRVAPAEVTYRSSSRKSGSCLTVRPGRQVMGR